MRTSEIPMSLLQFQMLAYEFFKLQQELLIIIFIIGVIIIIAIFETSRGAIIFFDQDNFCSTKTRCFGLVNQTIRFF
jgi:hypothetical protein